MHGTGRPLGRFTSEVPEDAQAAARRVAEVLSSAHRVLVLGHVGADGDVAGSSLGLAQALRELGKEVTVYNELPYPESFDWLPGAADVVHTLPKTARFDATVVVDAADPARCGRHFPPKAHRGTFVWIDHHRIAEPPGDVSYIDLTAAAVGEQIAEVLAAMGHPISADTAKCLYASLMSDTGGFRYGNTSARAFTLAGRLVAAGVDPWEMTQHLYESQAEERVRLMARALTTLWRSSTGKVGLVVVTERDLELTGATAEHAHGIVNHVRGIRGVEIAVLLREVEDGTEVVLRSRGSVSAVAIAERLGASGHKNAARFRLPLDLDEARVLVSRAADDVAEGARPPRKKRTPSRRRARATPPGFQAASHSR